jgi:hypothetical protein
LLLFRWSFRDKKRVEAIVHNFHDLNSRIHEKVKLWCLASELGVNVQHLHHLRSDDTSRQLGFDVDATLRLTAWDAEVPSETLEIQDPAWDKYIQVIEPVPNQGLFATFTKDGATLIQENHAYEQDSRTFRPGDLSKEAVVEPRTKKRIESLARLLHQPKEQIFRIPRCLGWKYLPMQNCIAFVFEVQPTPEAEPLSLLRLLNNNTMKPSLGEKFRLALGLARCVSQLHMVKWVSPLALSGLLSRFLKIRVGARKLPQ